MTPRTALATCAIAFAATTAPAPARLPDAAEDLLTSRLTAHASAANQAIAWSAHTAEVVNVGLTVREHTIVNVAMFEAVNAITRRYQPYALTLAAPDGTSTDAAVATAAYRALRVVWPGRAALWTSLYDATMSRIPDGAPKSDGVTLGTAAAEGILKLRAGDVPFPGPTRSAEPTPGAWRPNGPELTREQAGPYAVAMGLPPLTAYASWTPWAIESAGQFRPPAPPRLNSDEYARDVEEVRRVGGFDSQLRTEEQTREARFYFAPAPRIFGPFAHGIAARQHLDITDSARFFALLSLALMDSQIACFDAGLSSRR